MSTSIKELRDTTNHEESGSSKIKILSDQSRLVLGTAQLGMTYGIANKSGRPDSDLARKIVETAWENGIREYDTAQDYGDSERVLGFAARSLGITSEVKVISKLQAHIDHLDEAALKLSVNESLKRLNVPKLFGLMLHREEYIQLWEKGLGDILQELVAKGLTEHVGASVYSPVTARIALEMEGISMVMIPGNLLDRRFENARIFDLAAHKNKKLYVRSVFLQGLLLVTPDRLPEHMEFASGTLRDLASFSQQVGMSIRELCIGYIKHAWPNAFPVLGVETALQLKENLECWNSDWPNGLVEKIQVEFEDINDTILNPSLWSKRAI